jgi:hypothetical protein
VELIKEIGAIAGIGAFFGLAVLSLLYFSQARDVRRLREWAGRAPEREEEAVEATSDLAAERAEEIRKVEEERREREANATAEREAAATAERDAAEDRDVRRQRREAGLPERTRMERLRDRFARDPGSTRRFGTGSIVAAVAVALVLIAGAAILITQLGDSGDENGSPAAAKGAPLKPGQIEVAVLNGTNPPVNGLAGTFSDRLENKGFRTGRVGNSSNSFTQSVVMFKRGHKPEASMVARNLQIPRVRLMTPDIVNDTAGESVAVIVGQDEADAG